MTISRLYDLNHTLLADYLQRFCYPWEALPPLADAIRQAGKQLSSDRFDYRGDDVWIAKSATVAPTALINGPGIIDEDAQVRHGAFIRGSAMVGKRAVVGNSVELKNCILFDEVQVPHYNYVGDSILGYRAHMGAGAVTSNVKSDRSPVVVRGAALIMPTDLKKCGAMIGDHVEIGCNCVLNPGTVSGRSTQIYPTSCVRGIIPEQHIYKDPRNIIPKRSR